MKTQATGVKQFHTWLDNTARAFNKEDALKCLELIKSENIDVYNWIVDPTNESKNFYRLMTALFPCVKYNINTSNLVECFNNWIKSLRDKPITMLLDGIMAKIITKQEPNSQLAEATTTRWCPKVYITIAKTKKNRVSFQCYKLINRDMKL